MTKIRGEPCIACPYRRDVPSGLWHAEEYFKLVKYEGETWEQPTGVFACHATPEFLCHGWAVVSGYDSLGLRLDAMRHNEPIEIPESRIPLFGSHREAAEHGLRQINKLTPAAKRMIDRLVRKHPRLRE